VKESTPVNKRALADARASALMTATAQFSPNNLSFQSTKALNNYDGQILTLQMNSENNVRCFANQQRPLSRLSPLSEKL
jgi:hypothetical protein